MKILKHKNIMGLIYSALLCMPLLAIGVRSAYVVVNKNAYQSYSGNIETTLTTQYNLDDLKYGETYSLILNPQSTYTGGLDLYGDYIRYLNYSDVETDLTGYTRIQFYGNNQLAFIGNGLTTKYAGTTSVMKIDFIYYSQNNTNFEGLEDAFYQTKIVPESQLDNVFEYSVNKFVSENNLGQINMFSWFTNLFLSDNATNNLYVGFANWYMNYAMLISCMHLLFLVLMWFVNYSRRLLDRGMNYDW